jgi:hypothetical protein
MECELRGWDVLFLLVVTNALEHISSILRVEVIFEILVTTYNYAVYAVPLHAMEALGGEEV